MKPWTRSVMIIVTITIAVTAGLGGAALLVGAFADLPALVPDRGYLADSPFDSYVLPGLLLILVIGETHAVAAVFLIRRSAAAGIAVAVAGFGILIWIFVQMMFIPFSGLQAIYFAAGLGELGLLLVALGLLNRPL